MDKYNPSEIEKKWQGIWEEKGVYKPDLDKAKKPFFNLMMFPYPSAEGMHVGNMYAFTGSDIYGRFMRMQGYDVFEPIGLDGFGIHSENYAIKVGRHPKEQAALSEKNFYRQLRSIGNGFDWSRTVETYDPEYYKWTQWIFIQLFKKGLAYRKKAPVNFCPSCKTVLADEQVIDGKCERCSSIVEKRLLSQWFFKITEYADALLDGLSRIDWTEKVKIAQREWIGKSKGAVITFDLEDKKGSIEVFTTRPDTLYGATFLVIAPEHEIAQGIKTKEVQAYIQAAKNKTEQERKAEDKEKTGVFSGLYVINPLHGEKIPVWIADYALMGYGTGALFGDAHDDRDVAFANKYNIPLKATIITGDKEKDKRIIDLTEVYTGYGTLIDSGEFTGLTSKEAMEKVILWLGTHGKGSAKTTYHLRDWLISRQRYWGPPIPMIFCKSCAQKGQSWFTTIEKQEQEVSSSKYKVLSKEKSLNTKYVIHNTDMAGWFPVQETELPVVLPEVADWKPRSSQSSSGQAVEGPLANHPEFYNVACPECGGAARRETDVSDTFLDSAWYFLRYIATDCNSMPFPMQESGIRNSIRQAQDKQESGKEKHNSLFMIHDSINQRARWLPVSMYIGGAEHSVLHLLYTRFLTKVFKDLKLISFDEPFPRFFAHGLIIKEGAKMSKSKGNVVVPDEYIAKFGADTLRTYLMFSGQFSQGGDFRDSGVEGMYKFLKRVWRLVEENSKQKTKNSNESSKQLDRAMHIAIKKVTEDLEALHYNTAIASIMEYYNALSGYYAKYHILDTKYCKTLVLLLAPFAPHMTEELWERIKNQESRIKEKKTKEETHDSYFMLHDSIHIHPLPTYDPKMLETDEVTIVVQVNGKVRDTIRIKNQESRIKKIIEDKAQESEKVKKYLEGKKIQKIVYVQGKIISYSISE